MSIGQHNAYLAPHPIRTTCPPGHGRAGQRASAATKRRITERFIYLAATRDGKVVKVGSSVNPTARTTLMCLGRGMLYPGQRGRLRVHLVQSWSLGDISYTEAVAVEYRIHRHLRTLTSDYNTEWYRLSTARAVPVVDALVPLPNAISAEDKCAAYAFAMSRRTA